MTTTDSCHITSARSVAPLIIAPAMLDVLLKTATEYTRIETLSRSLNLSMGNIQHELGRLEASGCVIDRRPHHGVRLIHSGLGAWVDYLKWSNGSSPSLPDRIIEVYQQTTSTQDAAKRLLRAHGSSAHRAVVVADKQTAGRGRLGRRWLAPSGAGATFSIVWTDHDMPRRQAVDQLTLATSVAVAGALASWAQPARIDIKWPNDLLVEGRKLAGILVETFSSSQDDGRWAAVVGIGVNVALTPDQISDPHLKHRVVSLAMLGGAPDRLAVISRILAELDQTLPNRDLNQLLDQWRQRSLSGHSGMRFQHNGRVFEGQVLDLDPTQGLIIRTHHGEIVHLPAATTTVLDGPAHPHNPVLPPTHSLE